ncbi:MAG: DUF2085 domain-containing protein [Ignavibacteria bacterium]|nr:DUF2085 domain-containing protein [Ignavibacteria bacterium]
MSEAVLKKQKTKLEFVFCHRKPERSFFYKGKQFPVCSRCTGFYLGYLSLPIFAFHLWEPAWWIIVLLFIPALIDGLTQAYMNRESNNWLRLITGAMAGVSSMAIASVIGKSIGQLILLIIS